MFSVSDLYLVESQLKLNKMYDAADKFKKNDKNVLYKKLSIIV